MRKFLLATLFFILIGCQINDKDYYNGTIREVIDSIERRNVNLLELNVNQDYISSQILIYDSLIVSYLFSDQKFFFNIINLRTGDLIGQFCHKGKGNNELLYCMKLDNCYIESNELKALVIDSHKNLLHEWNISKSIEAKETIFDTIIKFESTDVMRPYIYSYRMNDSTLLGYLGSSADDFNRTKPVLPAIELRDIYSGNVFKTINLYGDTFEDDRAPSDLINKEKGFIPAFNYFYSITDVRPDCKYAVQSMKFLAQLNIVNIETGEVKGIRLKDTPDFSIFKNYKKIKKQYFRGGLIATDDFIYAGYSGEETDVKGNNVQYIYKFNWDGDILDVYDLGLKVDQILYNKVTGELFAFDSLNTKLYLVDTKFQN